MIQRFCLKSCEWEFIRRFVDFTCGLKSLRQDVFFSVPWCKLLNIQIGQVQTLFEFICTKPIKFYCLHLFSGCHSFWVCWSNDFKFKMFLCYASLSNWTQQVTFLMHFFSNVSCVLNEISKQYCIFLWSCAWKM